MRVLLVEDHDPMREMLRDHLRQNGTVVDAVASGEDALAAAAAVAYDAVILDLGLPDLDGMDVLRRMRGGVAPMVPVLVLTARYAVDDRVNGLDAGADDYLPKPFDVLELDARLRSVTRRTDRRAEPELRFGDLRLDPASLEVRVGEEILPLTRRETALLAELLRGAGHTLPREALEERLYGFDDAFTANPLEATMSRLRKRLSLAGSTAAVETIRGIGYRLMLASPAASPPTSPR